MLISPNSLYPDYFHITPNIFLVLTCLLQVATAKNITFSRENFIVQFHNDIDQNMLQDLYLDSHLQPMIQTVASRFSKFFTANVRATQQDRNLPRSIAKFNRQHQPSPPIEVFIPFELPYDTNSTGQSVSAFDISLGLAEEANAIFPNTVNYLIGVPLYFNTTSSVDFYKLYFQKHKRELAKYPKANYKLGADFSIRLYDAGHLQSFKSFLSPLIKLVDVIVLNLSPSENDVNRAAATAGLVHLTYAFKKYKNEVKKINANAEVLFSTNWPDTDYNGKQSFVNLVNFWTEVNDWAQNTNTKVMVREAIDTEWRVSPSNTNGWWRYVPNRNNLCHKEYILEEKYVVATNTELFDPDREEYYINHFETCYKMLEKETQSFHPNIVVELSSQFNKLDKRNYNDDKQLQPMLETLSSKFSKVFTSTFGDSDEYNSVPRAAAKYNNVSLGQEYLDIYIIFDLSWTLHNEKVTSAFQSSVDLAKEANSISPGTVKFILGHAYDLKTYAMEISMYLQNVSVKLNQSGAGVNLGLNLLLYNCYIPNLSDYINLVKYARMFVFYIYPSESNYNRGGAESAKVFIMMFEKCQDRFKRMNSTFEIAFQTGWPEPNEDGGTGKDFYHLVLFWQRINAWVVKTQTKVFLQSAFDNPSKTNKWSTRGWWRVVPNLANGNINKFIFEDKITAGIRAIKSVAPEEDKGHTPSNSFYPYVIALVIALTISILIILIIVAFLKKRRALKASPNQMILLKQALQEFFEGKQNLDAHPVLGALNSAAYNNEFELNKKQFSIDESVPLGSGHFGFVCRGRILYEEGEVDVAVKTLKDSSTIAELKSLLSEIKVLAYLGKHKNIVSLVGAYTRELDKGKVFQFTEICENGSLEIYLRKLYNSIKRENEYVKLLGTDNETNFPGLNNLYKWSSEIACGMYFLASKHVVHADLATRNVLLTQSFTAKICDFGLSRRMYDYKSYVKKGEEPLPWRWLSPESLDRNEFNEKTDVWAYGVTLWEIYSLAKIPYPGLSWSVDFSKRLEQGLRLEEPEFNADNMYCKMQQCWELDPAKRPTFKDICIGLPSKYDDVS